jgi:hypothetical protein
MRPIRVLHCPELVGGNAQQLARAERAVGLDSVAVAFDQTVFAYGCCGASRSVSGCCAAPSATST